MLQHPPQFQLLFYRGKPAYPMLKDIKQILAQITPTPPAFSLLFVYDIVSGML